MIYMVGRGIIGRRYGARAIDIQIVPIQMVPGT